MNCRIKELRTYLGLSQAQFAQKINKTPGYISLVETARIKPSVRAEKTICANFHVNERWLKDGTGEMFDSNHQVAPVSRNGIDNRLRFLRKELDLTQQAFADKLGYSKVQITAVETGRVVPSNTFLDKVILVFNVNKDWLYTGNGCWKSEDCKITPDILDEEFLQWLREHPELVAELKGLKNRLAG